MTSTPIEHRPGSERTLALGEGDSRLLHLDLPQFAAGSGGQPHAVGLGLLGRRPGVYRRGCAARLDLVPALKDAAQPQLDHLYSPNIGFEGAASQDA